MFTYLFVLTALLKHLHYSERNVLNVSAYRLLMIQKYFWFKPVPNSYLVSQLSNHSTFQGTGLPEARVVQVLPDGPDVPELVGVEDHPRDGADEEDEDDGEENQLFDGPAETQVLVVGPLATTGCPSLALY